MKLHTSVNISELIHANSQFSILEDYLSYNLESTKSMSSVSHRSHWWTQTDLVPSLLRMYPCLSLIFQ